MDKKKCNKCGELKPSDAFYRDKNTANKHRPRCKQCTEAARTTVMYKVREQKKKWRQKNKTRLNALARERYLKRKELNKCKANGKARGVVAQKIRSGKVVRKPCCICGDEMGEMHHVDYSKPMKVLFLCKEHHTIWHRIERMVVESICERFTEGCKG